MTSPSPELLQKTHHLELLLAEHDLKIPDLIEVLDWHRETAKQQTGPRHVRPLAMVTAIEDVPGGLVVTLEPQPTESGREWFHIDCVECGSPFPMTDDHSGKCVCCGECEEAFDAKAATPRPEPPQPKDTRDGQLPRPSEERIGIYCSVPASCKVVVDASFPPRTYGEDLDSWVADACCRRIEGRYPYAKQLYEDTAGGNAKTICVTLPDSLCEEIKQHTRNREVNVARWVGETLFARYCAEGFGS